MSGSEGSPSLQAGSQVVREPHGRLWGGEHASEREARRRGQFVDAAFEILSSQGWREVTVERLSATTRLNKRYFYEAFGDLETLAKAVIDGIGETLLADMRTAVSEAEGLPPQQYCEVVFGALVSNLTLDARRARVLFGGLAATPVLERHRTRVITTIVDALADYGAAYHGLKPDAKANMAGALLLGGFGECILEWLDGRIEMTRESLITEFSVLASSVGAGYAARAGATD